MPEPEFVHLLNRVREGDEDAAIEVARRYEGRIRATLHRRIEEQAQLRRIMDSSDLCQSVLADFFIEFADGRYSLESPEDLAKLLTRMAKNKLAKKTRGVRTVKRGGDHYPATDALLDTVASPGETPSAEIGARELIEVMENRLSPFERFVAQQRKENRTWGEIAEDIGQTPDALRKRLARAAEQIFKQLGLIDAAP
jgi:RNA polymerase sigma-70 factor (ECF subfamily)